MSSRTSWVLDDLVGEYVAKTAKHPQSVGIEWERSGIYRDSLRPVRYLGTQGYLAVLQKLVDEVGWEVIEREPCGIIALARNATRVTIEGDGRPELSGSPQASMHDLAREFRIHSHEIAEMGNVFNIGWLPLGMQPLHRDDEIEMVPRARYQIFQNVGDPSLMQSMTKRTNGLTANISYQNEESAVRIAQTAFRVLPVIGAMFASSPLDAGAPSKYLDHRRWAIQSHCPSRTGIPPSILDPAFSLRDWMTYYGALPVLLRKRDGITTRMTKKMTFSQWMEKGVDGDFPTMDDFDQHVKTTWSDLRLRPSYLEYRVADSIPFRHAMALPALMKGLLLDAGNWEKIAELTRDWTYDEILAADQRAWKQGLKTKINGVTLLTIAQQLLIMATESLHTMKIMDAEGNDESIFLTAIKEWIFIKERSPAEEILTMWESDWQRNPQALVEWCNGE